MILQNKFQQKYEDKLPFFLDGPFVLDFLELLQAPVVFVIRGNSFENMFNL